MPRMTDGHRRFAQGFVHLGIMNEAEMKKLYFKSCEEFEVPASNNELNNFLATVNNNLKTLSMEIRQGKSEQTGQDFYALVNCSDDDNAKLGTNLTPPEIAFFKKVLETIVPSDNGEASSMELINLGAFFEKKLSASFCEDLLARLVKDQWLAEESGKYYLGVRTLTELSMYLKNEYTDLVKDCKICLAMVVWGHSCNKCSIKIHIHCAKRYFGGRAKQNNTCPGCSTNWIHTYE